MKKIIILLAVSLSLVLLLGSMGPSSHIGSRGPIPHIHDPNSEPEPRPCSLSRMRILKYEVFVASDPKKLETKVTQRLKGKGNWIPLGGISVDNDKYHQAMVMVKE